MTCPTTGSIRSLASRTLLVLLTLISTLDAAETNVCTVAANPSGFDHRQVTLKGIVAGLSKSTSRSGHKQMTFPLRTSAAAVAWIMNGTCGPKSGYRLIAISPAVGGAAGWAGDMVQWRAPPEIDVKLAAAPARRRGRPPSGRTLVPFRRG